MEELPTAEDDSEVEGSATEGLIPTPVTVDSDKQTKKWRNLVRKIQAQKISSREAVDFFNSVTGIRYQPSEEEDEDSVHRESSGSAQFGSADKAARYQAALFQPPSSRGLMTIASKSQVTLEEKLEDVTQLWSPEEDGLYIGYPPVYNSRKWILLERRLVSGGHRKWFRSDGSVAVLPDPLRPYLLRNVIQPPEELLRPLYLHGKVQNGGVNGQELDRAYPLHVFISGLHFDHHWLFGAENVLVNQLQKNWQIYYQDGQAFKDRMNVLARKLRALYQAHDAAVELLDQLQINNADANIVSAQIKRIALYREAIGSTRGEYYGASANHRRTIQSLTSSWRQLKELRKTQGFQSTRFKLVVKKTNDEDERLDWDEEVSRQLDEARRLFQQDVRREIDQFKKERALWKARRKKKTKKSQEEEEDEIEEEEPEPPEKRRFDEEKTRAQILKVMKESLAPPSERSVNISLGTSGTNSNHPQEQRRIEMINKHEYQARIFVNRQESSTSNVFRLSPESDYTAGDIQQNFLLWIREKPHTLSLQISYSKANAKKWVLIAEMPISFPSSQSSFANQIPATIEFNSTLTQPEMKDLGTTGSGRQKNGDELPMVQGTVTIKLGWGTDASGHILAPDMKHIQHSVKTSPVANGMEEWMGRVQLDPNDPAVVEILDRAQKMKALDWRAQQDGSDKAMSDQDDETFFCSKEELEMNIRFKLLKQRANDKKPFSHLAMIPSRPAEIPQHLIKMLENGSVMESRSSRLIDHDESTNKLEQVRRMGLRKLLKMYSSVNERLSSVGKKKLQLADLVINDHIPDMNSFRGELMPMFFKPHRPLRPERKERNITPILAGLAIQINEEIRIRVNVIRAHNIPVKNDSSESFSSVGPFVQASFQKGTVRTSATGNGPNPTWNQELFLPVQLAEGFRTLASLQSVDDDLFIQLFDEVVVDILDDDRQRDVSVHQRFERHWLGGFKIPFQIIYRLNKIEGTFTLNLPLIPIGYQTDRATNSAAPLLTVLISLHPAASPPRPDHQLNGRPTVEDSALLEHVREWRAALLKEFPNLNVISPLVCDEQAMTVYIGRFLTPMTPPEDLIGSDDVETVLNLSQFIAAIPPAPNYLPLELPRIWLTCKTMLELLTGGGEEKGVLLCNYLSALNYENYLVLGLSIPEGETAFVLYKDKTTNTWWMINPSTGAKTHAKDPNCSLQSVWAMVNQNDYWVNLQPRFHPSQLQFFQVENKSIVWRSLFSRRCPNPCSPVGGLQFAGDTTYVTTSNKDVRSLEESITEHLKQSFMKWRKTSRTKWNRHASQIFRDILVQTGKEANGTAMLPTSDKLEQLLQTYKVFGISLREHFYTDKETLSDALYATGLHRHQSVEFALAVWIRSFPHNLLQVFIYCANLQAL